MKTAKVDRNLRKEGVSQSNIIVTRRATRKQSIDFNNLVGREVKRKGVVGKIAKYDPEGPYHWFIEWANGDSEYFNKSEIKLYLV